MELTNRTVERAAHAGEGADGVVRAIRAALGHELRGRRVSVWGLESGAVGPVARVSGVRLAEALLEAGAAVSAHDEPLALDAARLMLGDRALLLDDAYLATVEAEALVVTSAWSGERGLDLERLRECMARPFLVDARMRFDGYGFFGFRFDRGFGSAGLLGFAGMLARPAEA